MVKFTNAILRRLGREGKEILKEHTNPTDNIARWLLSEWTETYGVSKTLLIIQQLLDENAHNYVDLSLKGHSNEEVEFIINTFKECGLSDIQELPNGSLRVKRGGSNGQISKWPLYDEGKWWVQDVSSTLPALAMISTLRQKYGTLEELTVVDMCAAPGGKTSQLLSAGFGSVVAVEASKRRCRRLEENLERLTLRENCDIVVSNGQDWVPGDREINGILLDVPCSATGTANRRPDILQKDGSLGNLLETQEMLANHCVSILPPGGVLIYATCSLLARESEDQVSKLLEKGNVETLPFTVGEVPGFNDAIDENGWLRVLPGVIDGDLKICDGFFVARLSKKHE
jgi:16S rRNA (cytosine967-C5)-methyltransferase